MEINTNGLLCQLLNFSEHHGAGHSVWASSAEGMVEWKGVWEDG